MQLYLMTNGNVVGPYSEAELRDMLLHREIKLATPSCRAGDTEWATVGAVLTPEHPGGDRAWPPPSLPSGARLAGVSGSFPLESERSTASYLSSYLQAGRPKEILRERHAYVSTGGETKGIGRLVYFLLGGVNSIVLSLLNLDAYVAIGISILANLIFTGLRFKNIGKSGWWALIMFVPFVNLYYSALCVIAPAGYETNRRLDGVGKVLLFVILGLSALLVCFILLAILVAATAHPVRMRS